MPNYDAYGLDIYSIDGETAALVSGMPFERLYKVWYEKYK